MEVTNLTLYNQGVISLGQSIQTEVTVENTGSMDENEVIKFYIRDIPSKTRVPRHSLCGMQRVSLSKGEKKSIRYTIPEEVLQVIGDYGVRYYEPGDFILYAGLCQPDEYSQKLMGYQRCVDEARFVLE